MATFKGPKTLKPQVVAPPPPVKQTKMSNDLGFDSDEGDGSDTSSNESVRGSDKEDDGGMNFQAHMTLQRSLKRVTEEKLRIGDMLRVTQEQLRKCEFYLKSEKEAKQSLRTMSVMAQKKSLRRNRSIKKRS